MTPRRLLSLRVTLLAVALAAGVYAAALPLYLFFRVSRPALALGDATEAIAAVGLEVARRDSAIHQVLAIARGIARNPRLRADSLRVAHRLLEIARTPLRVPFSAAIAPALRTALGRTDDALSRVAAALADVVGALDAGHQPEAGRLATLDQQTALADHERARAGLIARDDLLGRQRALREAASAVRRDTLVWLALGLLVVPALTYVVRRRVWRPLHELEAGLAQVADGDLTVGVPVHGSDELGRLAEHFNAMTRVLRDRAEEQGRFAAAGELLAGVAHEVNNPLMAIAAHAENRLADPAFEGEQRGEMTQILRQARRATKLLRGLLRFVRASEREVTNVNLNDVVRGALDLVSYRFGVDEVTVGGRLDASLPPVQGDAIKLEQVVVNLLSNAIDALRAVTPPRHLTVDTWVQDGTVSVAVGDNGKGVASEFAQRLFRPFATTKGRRGTGLGLYISRQIAREAGGDLALTTPPGFGARFVLSLPVAAPAASASVPSTDAAPPPTAPAPVPSSGAPSPAAAGAPPAVGSLAGVRVLIVEDEEAVRRPMVRYLTRRGAVVDEAADGVEGLARLRAQPANVILADLRMPRMGGVELYAQLEEERPELAARVLFLSGDVSQLAAPGNTPVPRERVLVKPVELAELERRIISFVRGAGGTGM
ncbi:MAG TPA: ATP-binding protein [Gemmatimonadales bacterium]|nr:ATP-binding protein [Gemmatimonadales bacterium]